MKKLLIELEDVNFNYDQRIVLESIDLEVREGEFWALIGPNGSGKSTLINIILGLLTPKSGKVKLFGEDVDKFQHRELIGYVSQKWTDSKKRVI